MKCSKTYILASVSLAVALVSSSALGREKGSFKLQAMSGHARSQANSQFQSNLVTKPITSKFTKSLNPSAKLVTKSPFKVVQPKTITSGPLVFDPSKRVMKDPGKLVQQGPFKIVGRDRVATSGILDPGVIGPVVGPGRGPAGGILDPGVIGPVVDPVRDPIGPVGPLGDPPVADPGNPPPADPGNPPADPPAPPADPTCPPPHCPPHGGWGFPYPVPFPVGGGFGGGYCRPTVVQPVYAPVATTQPVAAAIDLELLEVRQLDRGDLAKNLGPAYRLTLREKSGQAVAQQFNVALAASIGRQATSESAFATLRISGLEAGQALAVELRLPAKAYNMGLNADGQAVPFSWLTAVVDTQQEVQQADRDNDLALLNRGEIVMVAQK